MQDMLTKILEMDEKARDLTAKAERDKAISEQDIAKAREKIYNEFLDRARQRIAINEKTEREAAEKKWQETKTAQEKALQALDEEYEKNSGKWVDSIVSAVING
ncbi:MAG: hypothetical protein ACI4I4_01185 [Acutalibacteraceae bacterium]